MALSGAPFFCRANGDVNRNQMHSRKKIFAKNAACCPQRQSQLDIAVSAITMKW
jgi:hypothetical protein